MIRCQGRPSLLRRARPLRRPRVLAAGVAIAALALLVGCAADERGLVDPGPATDVLDEPLPAGDVEEPLPAGDVEEPLPAGDVPDECRDAFPLAVFPADITDVEMQPANWAAPPADAVLCITASAMDGSSETLSYATDAAIGDVFAHYEASLGGYDMFRTPGTDNGTGYDTLDGTSAEATFHIREHDGGFVLVFARGDVGG
ncbi:hypothetical protein ACFC3F_11570 [Microbacterium sp. NPDC055910]|uniref:hypothetical protein n=1 Tax=Microbacterium sp. NPDC055910 TaxID=3345659 RepID=UPI0035DF49F5